MDGLQELFDKKVAEQTVEFTQKIDELEEKITEIEKEKSDTAEDAAAFQGLFRDGI